ncbi:Metallo-beta-lactamase superfamily protein [Phaeobacter sp. CECT 5382]|uniref:MBL fold metallo-hydrolase n=1 Tax=Phaeobacter sp. CECT 5382 TaxID=1712645 RepID=UPI0006D954C9|nr:MBL fold metallo-hydrolase [Phaeobacter sp. CECT 5382]CUH89068.1 Metallo-beta-lactamase superfamily protein [Phaeobacter sp. CECT 5382]
MRITRRQAIAGLGSGLILPGVGSWAAATGAEQAGAALTLGTMQIDTVSDGHLVLPREVLFGELDPQKVDLILQAQGIAPGPIEPPINVTLMRDGPRVVLFDAGSGPAFQASAGRLAEALEAMGVAADEVTHVVFTHCHPDHLWGVLDDFDEPLFPQAEYLMGQVEWDYWFAPETAETIDASRVTMAVGARRRMAVLEERFTRFRDGEEILPGVAAHATFGHTPGHMSFELRSGSESIMVGGDAIGNHHVSFAEPGWPIGTDQDASAAAQSRMRLLDQLSHEQIRLIGYHLPDGGLGLVERKDDQYRFVV